MTEVSNDFLKTQLLPGEPIPHHEHRKLVIVLVIVLVVAIALGIDIWWNMSQTPSQQVSAPVVVDQRTQMLNQALANLKPIQPATPEQIKDAVKQLSKRKLMNATQRAQALDQAISRLK